LSDVTRPSNLGSLLRVAFDLEYFSNAPAVREHFASDPDSQNELLSILVLANELNRQRRVPGTEPHVEREEPAYTSAARLAGVISTATLSLVEGLRCLGFEKNRNFYTLIAQRLASTFPPVTLLSLREPWVGGTLQLLMPRVLVRCIDFDSVASDPARWLRIFHPGVCWSLLVQAMSPLVMYYEIMGGMWVRNGAEVMRAQARAYVQGEGCGGYSEDVAVVQVREDILTLLSFSFLSFA
jgi:hypothetical protein